MNLSLKKISILQRCSKFSLQTTTPAFFRLNQKQLSSFSVIKLHKNPLQTLQPLQKKSHQILSNLETHQFTISKSVSTTSKVLVDLNSNINNVAHNSNINNVAHNSNINNVAHNSNINSNNIADTIGTKLHNIQTILQTDLKHIFDSKHDYRIYTPDIELHNHWNHTKPVTTKGITRYVLQVLKSRLYFNFVYPKLKVTISRSQVDLERGSVQCDWLINVLRTSMVMKIREVSPTRMKEKARERSSAMAGSSEFFVNQKGLIYKHVLQKCHKIETNENEDAASQSNETTGQKA